MKGIIMDNTVSVTKEQLLTIIQQLSDMHILDEHETIVEDNYIFIHCEELQRNKDTDTWMLLE